MVTILTICLYYLQSAVGAAAINIQVPILLGQVTDVVSKFTADSVGNFLEEIKKPAMKLMSVKFISVKLMGMKLVSMNTKLIVINVKWVIRN